MKARIRHMTMPGLGLALLCLAAGGCRQPLPPAPTGVTVEVGNGSVTLLRWKGGPAVMICSDVKAGASSEGGGTAGNLYKTQGYRAAPDGRSFDWLLETTDGKNVTCRLSGKDYDLANGTLFLVRTKGGKTEVEQLDEDLSGVDAEEKSCRDFARKNPAVRKLLGAGAE